MFWGWCSNLEPEAWTQLWVWIPALHLTVTLGRLTSLGPSFFFCEKKVAVFGHFHLKLFLLRLFFRMVYYCLCIFPWCNYYCKWLRVYVHFYFSCIVIIKFKILHRSRKDYIMLPQVQHVATHVPCCFSNDQFFFLALFLLHRLPLFVPEYFKVNPRYLVGFPR